MEYKCRSICYFARSPEKKRSFFKFAWEFCIEKCRGFWCFLFFFFGLRSYETKHENSSKKTEKIRSKNSKNLGNFRSATYRTSQYGACIRKHGLFFILDTDSCKGMGRQSAISAQVSGFPRNLQPNFLEDLLLCLRFSAKQSVIFCRNLQPNFCENMLFDGGALKERRASCGKTAVQNAKMDSNIF